MAVFSNLRRIRHFHNAVWGIGRTNSELAVQHMDKGALFATTMISQGILRGVPTMGHCGGKDGVH